MTFSTKEIIAGGAMLCLIFMFVVLAYNEHSKRMEIKNEVLNSEVKNIIQQDERNGIDCIIYFENYSVDVYQHQNKMHTVDSVSIRVMDVFQYIVMTEVDFTDDEIQSILNKL